MAAAPCSPSGANDPSPDVLKRSLSDFFVWREFVWGAFAGAFGEGMMHPIDTLKTRLQSQAIISGCQSQKNILQMVGSVWAADGLKGFYRGITPGVTGSLATGATYFGVRESTKQWIEEVNLNLSRYWSHFTAGAIGDTLGSIVYVPCEVIKQLMQVRGTRSSWSSMLMKESLRSLDCKCIITIQECFRQAIP